eukprot:GFUD01013252.1.p1 GENE.GFUD01013252.1~~GFUD01013252.1.p1  ORF type:complete len:389 (+),score=100.66 GFUD01013252.1:508-1674(+)
MVDNLQSNEYNNEMDPSSQTSSTVLSVTKPRTRTSTDKTDSGIGVSVGGVGGAEEESDSDIAAPRPLQPQRTRQKKFIKNFKHLQDEVVFHRISCALVGDILLQGHLYVTENYLAFHSNVFGYVTRIQLSMTSVTAINKEKTAKIIPNAVAVSTQDEVHTFTSFISRDATYNVMTKAWKNALAKRNILNENGPEDGRDGGDISNDYESTDTENSINPGSTSAISNKGKDKTTTNPVQRISSLPGSVFYQARAKGSRKNQPSRSQSFRPEVVGQSKFQQLVLSLLSIPTSMLLLITLTFLLILLFFSSTYLVIRLDNIQEKVDFALPSDPSHLQQLASWQGLLHSQSSKKVQEYLHTNLEQISKVRESLEKLSYFLNTESKRNDENLHH